VKTYEMQAATSPRSIEIHHGAIVVTAVTFATGADLVADAREAGIAGFHFICTGSNCFQTLWDMLHAGAQVLGAGLVDKTTFGDDYETVATLRIAVDPEQAEPEDA
jgi:hypothetical protein